MHFPFHNFIVVCLFDVELSPLTPDPTQVCPSSRMVSSESNTRRRKTLRSSFSVQESAPACDLC